MLSTVSNVGWYYVKQS